MNLIEQEICPRLTSFPVLLNKFVHWCSGLR